MATVRHLRFNSESELYIKHIAHPAAWARGSQLKLTMLLERIRERHGAVPPVVLITSEGKAELLARAAQLGAVGKPFTNVSIRQMMQKVVAPKQRA